MGKELDKLKNCFSPLLYLPAQQTRQAAAPLSQTPKESLAAAGMQSLGSKAT